MSTRAFSGRGSTGRLGLVVALVAGLATMLPATARAAGARTSTWHMDETSGSTMVDSTGKHPGKLTKAVALGAAGDPAFPGKGYHFNGTSAKVTIPNATDLNPGTGEVHISFSLRTTSVPAKPDFDLFRKGTFGQQQFKVELQPKGQVSCSFTGSSGSAFIQGGPDVHDGKWHSVRCEKFSSSVKLTVDGKTFKSTKKVGSISNTADMIVASHGAGEFFPGDLDELTYTLGSTGADSTPPTGTFGVTPSAGWAAYTRVTLTQSALADNVTAAGAVRRVVDWRDGRGAVAWPAGTTTAHVYAAAGSYTPRVTLTDQAGNSATVSTAPVTVRSDSTAPTTVLLRPGHRSSAAAWRVLKGRVGDAGSGVRVVRVSAVEKRGRAWYAYRPASHTWAKAPSRAAALRRSGPGRAVLVGANRWTYRIPGVRHGALVLRLVAGDHVGNTSRLLTYSQRLTRS